MTAPISGSKDDVAADVSARFTVELEREDVVALADYASAQGLAPLAVADAIADFLLARWRRLADLDLDGTLDALTSRPHRPRCHLVGAELTLELAPEDADVVVADARSIGRAFRSLLRFGVEAPARRLASVPLLPDDGLPAIRDLGRGGVAAPVEHATVLHAMAAQVASRPDAPAVVQDGRVVTYRQLFDRVESAATALATKVTRGDLVLIVAEQSEHALVGILAAASLGAAYVPVDLDWPARRLRQVLGQIGPAAAWISSAGVPSHLAAELHDAGVRQVSCDASEPWRATRLPDPDDRAYVLFTSGSTGEPKGVQATHRALAFMCAQANVAYNLVDGDRVLQFSSLVFDVSVWEIFGTLSRGACLVVPRRDDRLDPWLLTDLVNEQSVSLLAMTPSVLALLDPAAMPSVRGVSIGGELVRTEVLGGWWQPPRRSWNAYGPSETVVYALLHPLRPSEDDEPPLGRPLPGLELFVVDEMLRPVPIGAVGELCIAGPTVGAGYLNDPERTRQKYVPVPGEPHRIMYRSGDLVRWRPDGLIQFVRRDDFQVKVNGYRVELQEIESVLRRLEGVTNAAALVTRSPDGVAAIYAFAATERGSEELLSELRMNLPRQAVPARLVVMTDLPLNASGKVDRTALDRVAASGAPS
jgi:amino acid adenylation domain-containing protein